MRSARAILCLLLLAGAASAERDPVVRFQGNERIDAEDLVAAGGEDMERFIRRRDPAAAEDAAFEIERHYHRQGYPLARVEGEVIDDRAIFNVSEGPRVFLEGVDIEGAEVVEAEQVAALVKAPRSWMLGGRLYVKSDVDAAADSERKSDA